MSPPPCLYDTVIQSYVQLKSGFYSFHGPSYTIESQWANLGRSCPPGVQLLPHFEVWSYRACQPLQVVIHKFLRNSRSELRPAKVCPMHCHGTFWAIFAPGANIVPPIAYKSHSTPFPIRPHVLTPHSWLCDKTAGGVARRKKNGRRIISMSNNNNVLCHLNGKHH